MKIPLIILAGFSIAAGFMGIPHFLAGGEAAPEMAFNRMVAITSTAVALSGIGIGTLLYARLRSKEDPLKSALGAAYSFIVHKYYLDDIFAAIANFFQKFVANILYAFDWNVVIQKGVNGTAGLTAGFASLLRRAQTGRVQMYAMTFAFGVAALVFFILFKG